MDDLSYSHLLGWVWGSCGQKRGLRCVGLHVLLSGGHQGGGTHPRISRNVFVGRHGGLAGQG